MAQLQNFLSEIFPVVTLVIGALLGYRSSARLAAEQRFDDQHQRWVERRQDLLTLIQRQAHTMSEEALTALGMTNKPELKAGPIVDRDAPWLLRWNEARRDVINSAELLGDADVEARVKALVEFQDVVARTRITPKQIEGRVVSVDDQLRETMLSVEEPLRQVTSLVAQRYRDLEGPEPTFTPAPWWKLL